MPADLVDDAERWRALAVEARDVAELTSDPEGRQVMLFIAEAYERLALRAEARNNQKK